MSLECNHLYSSLKHHLHYHFIYICDDEQMVPMSYFNMYHSQTLFENTVRKVVGTYSSPDEPK